MAKTTTTGGRRKLTTYERKQAAELRKRQRTPGLAANVGAEAFLASLATPDGFAREPFAHSLEGWNPRATPRPPRPALRFVGHDGATTIEIVTGDVRDSYTVADGHTTFTTSQGSFSYDRIGVGDSFYVDATDDAAAVDAKIAEQIARVADARARHATSEKVPFVGHVVTPARKAEIAAALAAGKSHAFNPSGFGTGYVVSTRRTRFAKSAPAALATFFGVAALYYETTDCD